MKTLIYVGTNKGWSLYPLVHQFNKVLAFEPDPEMFDILVQNMRGQSHVNCYNVACFDNNGEATLHITPNRVATSLGEGAGREDYKSFKQVKVPTIHLGNFLVDEGIELIDYLVTDCQGSDLTILRTLSEYINNDRICKMQVETHGDRLMYQGLDNRFAGHKQLLIPRYKIVEIELGHAPGIIQESALPVDEEEWDTRWELVNKQYFQ